MTDFTSGEDKLEVLEIVSGGGGAIGNVGGNRLGRLRPVGFAELAIATDGTNSTVRFDGELLATIGGVSSLSAADVI